MKIFLDVDGVVLTHRLGPGGELLEPPVPVSARQWVSEGAAPFFDYATKRHKVYWLSSWSVGGRTGGPAGLRERLLPHLPKSAAKVKAARWRRDKTEAFRLIPDGEPFVWFEDDDYAEPCLCLEHEWFRGRAERKRRLFVLDPTCPYNLVIALQVVRNLEREFG